MEKQYSLYDIYTIYVYIDVFTSKNKLINKFLYGAYIIYIVDQKDRI